MERDVAERTSLRAAQLWKRGKEKKKNIQISLSLSITTHIWDWKGKKNEGQNDFIIAKTEGVCALSV